MGEYRVAADVVITRRITTASKKSRHPIFTRQDESEGTTSSLFEKYMPHYTNKKKVTKNDHQPLSQSCETPKPVNEALMNKRYMFWRDDPHSLSSIKKEEEGERRGGDDGIRADVSVENGIEDEDVAPLLERETTYFNLETAVRRKKKRGDGPPDDTNTVVLSTLSYSVLTGRRFKGTYYAFLMSTNYGKKKNTTIGVSRYPIFSVIAHNNQARLNDTHGDDVRLFPVIYDKDTASAAPHWRLDTALGPFFTKRAAENCCHEWVRKTRGTVSKQNKALKLVEALQCEIYSARIPTGVSFERYLVENNAPLAYIKACQSIKRESLSIVSELGDDI